MLAFSVFLSNTSTPLLIPPIGLPPPIQHNFPFFSFLFFLLLKGNAKYKNFANPEHDPMFVLNFLNFDNLVKWFDSSVVILQLAWQSFPVLIKSNFVIFFLPTSYILWAMPACSQHPQLSFCLSLPGKI